MALKMSQDMPTDITSTAYPNQRGEYSTPSQVGIAQRTDSNLMSLFASTVATHWAQLVSCLLCLTISEDLYLDFENPRGYHVN